MSQPSNNVYCSIVTLNYLAYAKTLSESLKNSGNSEAYYVLIVDFRPEYIDLVKSSGLNFLTLEQLNIPQVNDLIEKYSSFEFANILKPFYIKWLLKNHPEINYLVFLDSDIYVYDIFTDLFKFLDSHQEFSAVLTPHLISKQIAEDYIKRTDYTIEQSHFLFGLYNSGMLAYKNDERTRKFLDWHISKCSRFGFNMPELDLFNEQKVLDMAPLAFDFVGIYRNKCYNVAPWNYFQGMMRKKDNKYYIDDKPLVFFHFSGVHKNDPTNSLPYEVSPEDWILYLELIGNYRQRLIANGHEQMSVIPYGFGGKYKRPLLPPVSRPISPFERELVEMRQLLESVVSERDKLHHELHDIHLSHSWRLTYYIRKALDFMKGIST